ncbi:MAG: ammonium transporter [Actinomycetota bacterium]|nr:ammonium transporter [Actinomycetota bacterium]
MQTVAAYIPYPHWLNSGDNTWQLVAATLVGLMSLPGLAVLYGGLVQRKWVVNTMLMAFAGFSMVLIVWVLWAYNMGFSSQTFGLFGAHGTGFFNNLVGKPWPITSHFGEQNQATSLAQTDVPFHFPNATLAYFQVVFAAITPLLFLGSILGRMKFKAWLLFVPLWITFVYAVNAKLLWGGGFFAMKGAVDYSGGYVIHLAAGVTGFVLAWMVGPRLKRDRDHGVPHNLMLVAVGAGILWLGWNGFNGGDPFYAGVDAASAVLNTNLATAAGLLTWMFWDMVGTRQRKPTFLGAINGMICGLVGITPSAGWVDGYGAILVGLICSTIVWVAWNYLSRVRPFSKVDDALGVVYTHGIAGLVGGLLVGFLADPGMVEYIGVGKTPSVVVNGLFYTGSWHQEWEQFLAAVWIICFTAAMTVILATITKLVCRGLREKDAVLEIGDVAIHDEEVYPQETFAERVSAMTSLVDRE